MSPVKRATGPRGKADELASLLVRSRGRCEAPDARNGVAVIHSQQLQCCHILGRAHNATRTDLENLLCMCAACHFYFTHEPIEFADFVIAKIGRAKYDALRLKANTPTKIDWKAEVERLSALLAEVEQ